MKLHERDSNLEGLIYYDQSVPTETVYVGVEIPESHKEVSISQGLLLSSLYNSTIFCFWYHLFFCFVSRTIFCPSNSRCSRSGILAPVRRTLASEAINKGIIGFLAFKGYFNAVLSIFVFYFDGIYVIPVCFNSVICHFLEDPMHELIAKVQR